MIRCKASVAVLFSALLVAGPANAIPAFARKYDMNCAGCHTAYPQLNAVGREFKESGYRFPGDDYSKTMQEVSDFLHLEKHVPLSGILVSRPYDKKDSGDDKVRAIHEVELIAGGVLAPNWSGYFEFEAEDETGFEPEVGAAALSFNYRPEFNVQFAWAPIFWADSYGILGNHFRLTRGSLGAIDQSFGGADAGGKLRTNRQNVGIFGRFMGRLFYNVNWSGDAADAEGENAGTFSGLLNFDITPDIMVGVFGVDGENDSENRDFSRAGVQFQADVADARLQAIYSTAKDDRDMLDPRGPGEDENDAYSLQAFWVFHDDSLRPTFVPLVRFDSYETNDGNDDFKEVTLNLTYYATQNVKAYIEYWDRFDAPTSAEEDDRITLQLIGAF